MSWYLEAFKRYAEFGGRSRRKEYWCFMLFNIVVIYVLAGIDALLETLNSGLGVGLLIGIYALAALIPLLAVSVRRLHDVGRSGWWYFVSKPDTSDRADSDVGLHRDGQHAGRQSVRPEPERGYDQGSLRFVVRPVRRSA